MIQFSVTVIGQLVRKPSSYQNKPFNLEVDFLTTLVKVWYSSIENNFLIKGGYNSQLSRAACFVWVAESQEDFITRQFGKQCYIILQQFGKIEAWDKDIEDVLKVRVNS